ncbi:hypothetical protein OK006_8905 [Actinobacteria bacterium OK006]|nr:hypothetical protein OK006_8905 [Actinobacteria bacterium OK006]
MNPCPGTPPHDATAPQVRDLRGRRVVRAVASYEPTAHTNCRAVWAAECPLPRGMDHSGHPAAVPGGDERAEWAEPAT